MLALDLHIQYRPFFVFCQRISERKIPPFFVRIAQGKKRSFYKKRAEEKIRRAFLSGEMLPCTLATRAFKYDALIAAGKREYMRFILGEIRHDYGAMLDAGSATTWETVTGAADFGGAGSLCHGWSALPAACKTPPSPSPRLRRR